MRIGRPSSVGIKSDIQKKETFDVQNLNPKIFEEYLTILARVFRNSDDITNEKLTREILDFLIKTYCSFGFFLIDNFELHSKDYISELADEEEKMNILKIVSSFIPIFIEVSMYDGFGHHNIEKLIRARIEELKDQQSKNQYELFLLYFLLLDLDLQKNIGMVDDFLNFINIGILKTGIVFKLTYYLKFKCYNNKQLEQIIRNKLQAAQKFQDPEKDLGAIHKSFERTHKQNLIKKEIRS